MTYEEYLEKKIAGIGEQAARNYKFTSLIGDDEYNYLDYVQRREQAARDAEAKLCCICTQSSTKKCDQYGCNAPLCNSRYCNAEHKEKHFQPLT